MVLVLPTRAPSQGGECSDGVLLLDLIRVHFVCFNTVTEMDVELLSVPKGIRLINLQN